MVYTYLYAVNATKLPIKISPSVWMLLAIPVCMLAAEGASGIMGIAKKSNAGKYILLILIIVGVYLHRKQKIAVNTAQWFMALSDFRRGGGALYGCIRIFRNSQVYILNDTIIGMDMYNYHWCRIYGVI